MTSRCAFPPWLAPDQVRVITIGDDEALVNYSKQIVSELRPTKSAWSVITAAIR